MVLKREAAVILLAVAGAVAGLAYYLTRPTTLSIAAAPSGGIEPALIKAFAETLVTHNEDVRLRIVPFDGVRESAEALAARKVDLAVVRPDVAMPENGLTLAILREQALLIAAPDGSGIKAFSDIARRRLGFVAERATDQALFKDLLDDGNVALASDASAKVLPPRTVALVPVAEDDLAKAFVEKRIDALVLLTTPTTAAAKRIVGIVQNASRNRKVSLIGVPDAAAVVRRMPKLQAVTVAAGQLGGNPKIPEEDVSTVGASYRLMARADLSRSLAAEVTEDLFELRSSLAASNPAANAVAAPAYETTADATSARLPNHPGAIDYFEREQESFIERYETWIYLLAFLGGGLGSAFAWLRQRVTRIRRERIEIATERLLEIRSEARTATETAKLADLAEEIDDLAAKIASSALERPAESRTIHAATIAIDAARSTVIRNAAQARTEASAASKRTLRAVD